MDATSVKGVVMARIKDICLIVRFVSFAAWPTRRLTNANKFCVSHLTKRTAPHALTDIAPETLALMRKYLVAHDTPLYNLARERLLKEIKAVERATGARLGKTCGIDGDDDDGDDDATLVRARRVPGSGPGGK